MVGAIIGDIVGSRFEFKNYRKKDFQLFTDECFATDDSILTFAVAKSVIEYKSNDNNLYDCYMVINIQINSYGNGAAMRVSACGLAADNYYDAINMSDYVTATTHNHIEGLKGARAVTDAIWMARNNKAIEEIKEHILKEYYNIDFTIDEIRNTYRFNETCQGTVPQALQAFFESKTFEDALRSKFCWRR